MKQFREEEQISVNEITQQSSIPQYTRYNLAFRAPNTKIPKNLSYSSRSAPKEISFHRNQSEKKTSQKLYNKYAFFPPSMNTSANQTQSGEKKKSKKELIKWIGTKATKEEDLKKGYWSQNAFPKGKKKTGNQVLINMLFKYDRYFGQSKSPNEKIKQEKKPSYMSLMKKQKLMKYKMGWIRKNANQYQKIENA